MSLEKAKTTMKPSLWVMGEGRRNVIRLGNDTLSSTQGGRSVPESRNNGCYASRYRHGGVSGVGMWRSEAGKRRGILICDVQASRKEAGKVHSSVEALVMRRGAKEPYLVAVNRRVKDK